MTIRSLFTAIPLLAALAASAAAQDDPPTPIPAPLPPPPATAPYEQGLVRLSEILGAMHYLRELCGAGEGTLWRDQMQGLIDAEQADGPRRARLVDGFNRGYEGFKSVYRACTPAAATAIDRYMEEGAKIARDVAARYGREE
jgi:uncharacterized protein (TIGR02301 family)